MTTIIISGLPQKIDEMDLVKLLVPYAGVNTVHIVCDRKTGKPKGMAFIELHHQQEALNAIVGLDGTFLGDARLLVKLTEDKPEKQVQPPKTAAAMPYVRVERSAAGLKNKRPRIG